jgi:hypothetical protein
MIMCGWCTTFIKAPEDENDDEVEVHLPPPLAREKQFSQDSTAQSPQQIADINYGLQRQSDARFTTSSGLIE